MRETSPRKTRLRQKNSVNDFDKLLGFTIPTTKTVRDGYERQQTQPAAAPPWLNPTQLERPAFLLNFPFSYSTECPNNPWMQDLSADRRQPDFKRATIQFLELYRTICAEALVYLLPTPRGAKPAGSSRVIAARPASSDRAQRTLALRINIDAKVAVLGERKADHA